MQKNHDKNLAKSGIKGTYWKTLKVLLKNSKDFIEKPKLKSYSLWKIERLFYIICRESVSL
jgi:hypothetical protein